MLTFAAGLFVVIVVSGLATWQAIEVYHHSAVMAPVRAAVEARSGFWSDLASCPFCLSVWVAAACVAAVFADCAAWYAVAWLLRQTGTIARWALVLLAPVCAFLTLAAGFVSTMAAARLANVSNDLTHAYCRTPKADAVFTHDNPK